MSGAFLFRAAQRSSLIRPHGVGRLRAFSPTQSRAVGTSLSPCAVRRREARDQERSQRPFRVFSSEAAQKGLATRPQARQTPEVYLLEYIEDVCEPRTTHGERLVSASRGWAGEKGAFSAAYLVAVRWRARANQIPIPKGLVNAAHAGPEFMVPHPGSRKGCPFTAVGSIPLVCRHDLCRVGRILQ